jgi:Flp pilus assembly protein TadB
MERRNMTTMHIRQCPRCELRFTSSSELQDHLTNDHRPRRDPSDNLAVPPPPVRTHTPAPAPPLMVGPAAAPRSRAVAWVLALVGLLLIALVAWLASPLIALITSAWVVLLALCYLWRFRIRTRTRHR